MISTCANNTKAESPPAATTDQEHVSPGFAVLIVLFTFLLFADTINHYFVMDDFDVLYSVKSNSITQALLGYGTVLTGRFFRPIPMLLFRLEFNLFGPWPVAYHVSTLLQHALCAILAANLFYLLFKDSRIASIFGFVFVAFPNHAEVIHSIAINLTSVATLFFLATLNVFCYYRLTSRKPVYVLSIVLFLMAILSHEMTYTLPLGLVATDFFLSRSRHMNARLGKGILTHLPYFVLVFSVLLVTRKFLNTGAGYLTVEGENVISLYLNNIYALFVDLTHMYIRGVRYLFAPIAPAFPCSKSLTVFILLALSFAVAVLAWKKRTDMRALSYCLILAIVTLLPVIGTYRFQAITHWVRFLYLPSVAACYVISMAFGGLSAGITRPLARIALLAALIFPAAFLTKSYDKQWIQAEDENKNFISALVQKCRALPEYSRVYVSGVPQMKEGVPRVDYALASAMGLYCDRAHLQVDSGFLPAIKILDLAREPYDEHHWSYFWLQWNSQTGSVGEAAPIHPDSSSNGGFVPKTWDFAEPGDNMGLDVTSDISRVFAPHSPEPLFKVEGGLALLKLPPVGAGPPIKYLTLEMMMKGKNGARDISRIFWVTKNELNYGGGRSIGFYVEKDGKFHEYKVPLYRNGQSLTDPDIVRFAIRPSQEPGTVFIIRKIKVEYY